ncbi:hypothetical protein B0H10DRAFT_1175759 [Mycena sp. CBHHK59/15]|nr:hypothetical protein B0H10DRAFT_1175759 [Mycena sp. CBHHK59/15]
MCSPPHPVRPPARGARLVSQTPVTVHNGTYICIEPIAHPEVLELSNVEGPHRMWGRALGAVSWLVGWMVCACEVWRNVRCLLIARCLLVHFGQQGVGRVNCFM